MSWPKCLQTETARPKCPMTETAQTETAQTETARPKSPVPTRASPEKESCPKIFHCIEYTFYIHDLLTTCPENRVCPEVFHCNEYTFYYSGFLRNCALALEIKVALKIFILLNVLFTFRIF